MYELFRRQIRRRFGLPRNGRMVGNGVAQILQQAWGRRARLFRVVDQLVQAFDERVILFIAATPFRIMLVRPGAGASKKKRTYKLQREQISWRQNRTIRAGGKHFNWPGEIILLNCHAASDTMTAQQKSA